MPIDTKRQEYTDNIPKWDLVEAFVDENIVALPKLLRKIDASDKSIENTERNAEYKEGAVLINVTKRTHDGMVGACFRKAPRIELPGSVEYLNDDVNGSGIGLTQFSKKVLSNTMQTGRDGILTDFPPPSEDTTIAATEDRKAKLIEYAANQIINWATDCGKLSMVILCEVYRQPVDAYAYEDVKQYRELRLEDGYYIQRLWREQAGDVIGTTMMNMVSETSVTDYNGKRLEEITFCFVGTINNDTEIDPSLLYSIATINKGHYRNSADLEENSFVHGQLTLGITSDLDAATWKEVNPGGVKVGARKGHYLGQAGGFHSVQAAPNQLTAGLMTQKEQQMVSIGARLIQTGGNEREVAVLSRIGAETATLSSLTHNVSEAIEQSITWADGYMAPTVSDNVFVLNQDFFPKSFDAQQIMALIQLYDRGRIAAIDLHQNLQQSSIVGDERELDDIETEASDINPLMTTV